MVLLGLLGLRLVVISERFRFHCSLSVLQRLVLLSAHVDINLTAQCDLFRLGEAERGAVQSKATVRAALATIGPG